MDLTRRQFTTAAALGLAAASASARNAHTESRDRDEEKEDAPMDETPKTRSPRALFVSHGAPSLAIEPDRGADLRTWGAELTKPKAVVVVSAHWERTPLTLGTVEELPLIHDYGGFPDELRRVRYDAKAARTIGEDLARALPKRLGLEDGALARRDTRGWDHGVWVPLVHLFPERDVPVVQLSLASRSRPAELIELGAALTDVLPNDVLVLASGGFVHNLRTTDWSESTPPQRFATDFEGWARGAVEARDLDALADFETKAPALRYAHPSLEHWLPVLVAAGAGEEPGEVTVEGFEYGSLSRLSFEVA